MKTEHKYYVEWTVNDQLHKSEVILGVELLLQERYPFVRKYIKEYYQSITKEGTRVKVREVKYLGSVLRIE